MTEEQKALDVFDLDEIDESVNVSTTSKLNNNKS